MTANKPQPIPASSSEPALRHPLFNPWLGGLVLLALAGNIAAWLRLPLLPDEAYYWLWSQRPGLSYYDHPPLVAWLISPFTGLFGDVTWAIRIPAVLSWGVGAAFAFALASRIFQSRRAGALAVLVWSSLPIVQAGFHIVTPDTPMIIFAWAAYYFAYRAVADEQPLFWLAAGCSAGLSMLGKYPGVLVPSAIFLALMLSARGRAALRTPWPWLGMLAAVAAFSPVLLWNYRHDWVSFAFQFGHGVKKMAAGQDPFQMFLLFLGGQLAVTMPWTWFAMTWAGFRGTRYGMWPRPWAHHLLAVAFWMPLIVFGLAGLTAKSHPNWPVAAYLPGTVLLAGALRHWLYPEGRGTRRWVVAMVIVAALIPLFVLNLMRFPDWVRSAGLHLPPQRTQLSQAYGWDEVEAEMRALLKGQAPDCVIVGDRLQTAAMAAFRLDAPERVTTASDTRMSQFNLWEQEKPIDPANLCLFVAQYDNKQKVPATVDLGRQGSWERVRLLQVNNPDLSVRWYGLFVPAPPDNGLMQ